jgi:uncharacterized protein (DUF2384 family)
MNIDDILQRHEFRALDDLLNEELRMHAGPQLVEMMNDVFGNEARARDWFFSECRALEGERPYDYCRRGKTQEVYDVLGRIEMGVYP